MKYANLTDKFLVAQYNWALQWVEKEVAAGFPLSRSFKNPETIASIECLEKMSQAEALATLKSYIRLRYQKALAILGQEVKDQDKRVLGQFRRSYDERFWQIDAEMEKLKSVSKRELYRKIFAWFSNKPLGEIVCIDRPDLIRFKTDLGLWQPQTCIWADRGLSYVHLMYYCDMKSTEESVAIPLTVTPGQYDCFVKFEFPSTVGIPHFKNPWQKIQPNEVDHCLESLQLCCEEFFVSFLPNLENFC